MELPAKSWDPGNGDWSPNCDVSVSPAGVTILVELAGLRSADIDLTMHGNRLQIQGKRLRPDPGRFNAPPSGEVKFGRFHAVFEFPAGYNLTQSQAYYLNGFLRIDVPAEESTSRIVL
jgi:HSP20 family molecular chaperone IbpA